MTNDTMVSVMHPTKHKSDWNALRLIMQITEINYCVFIDTKIDFMEIHAVTKDEFRDYYYNPN